ncbi:related to molecular chaperone (DnaJ superfamily) [Ramularia collo-cygni]|uniref:Related to molecular chaperone (DnaJ superfamily) n=1 Tax=Ramularia collo-cygni TaxID=112498 RepID=A0A2D3VPE9_9PEZI|nr:related to molecular chaperone (DnaJ superfamily) [Ramularia collo-cygni]CZT24964.1 related to molecular chaperone (DnaJ superfamily) [Ramularia collo-cygni]
MVKRPRSDDDEEEGEEEEEELEGEMPTAIDPYEVLSIKDRSASQDDIKRAYRKAALKYHPDKAAEADKATAHTKFQEVACAFAVLSDERRRRRYDLTGSTEESLDLDDDDFNWSDFYRGLFDEMVTEEKINDFATEYKGSEEERGAVIAAYEKHKGKMTKLYQEVMLSDMVDDEDRFREIIDAAIAADEVESFKAYTEESENARRKRIANAKRQKGGEAGEAEALKKEMENKKQKRGGNKADAGGGLDSLAAMIQGRQKARGAAFDRIEEKYGGTARQKGRDEPSEEAFAKNAKKPSAKRAKK